MRQVSTDHGLRDKALLCANSYFAYMTRLIAAQLTVRPANTVKTVQDVARPPKADPKEKVTRPDQRCILDVQVSAL